MTTPPTPPVASGPIDTQTPERIYSACDGQAVTPADAVPLAIGFCRALFVGGAGNLTVTLFNGTKLVFTGVLAGTILPVAATVVWATGTSATNITAMK